MRTLTNALPDLTVAKSDATGWFGGSAYALLFLLFPETRIMANHTTDYAATDRTGFGTLPTW